MILEFIFRWAHVLFGLVWIGMLYYFNFVQTEYFKEAEKEAALPGRERPSWRREPCGGSAGGPCLPS